MVCPRVHLLALLAALGGTPAALADDGHGHAPPAPVQSLTFTETQRVLGALPPLLAGLRAGPPARIVTPWGARLTVPLLYQGQVVARVLLGPGGTLASMQRGPVLPDARPDGALDARAESRVREQLRRLTLLGAVQATPGEYRVILLAGNVPVAALRLDRRTLQPKADPGLLGRPLDDDQEP